MGMNSSLTRIYTCCDGEGWMALEGQTVKVFVPYHKQCDRRFGMVERFELTFNDITVVQPFTKTNEGRLKEYIAMIATPEKNKFWQITTSEVKYYQLDQVEVTGEGIFVRKDDDTRLICSNGGQWIDEDKILLCNVPFKTILKREGTHHWQSPGTLESRDGHLYIISTEDDITIKLG
jgi:hypothetical protein